MFVLFWKGKIFFSDILVFFSIFPSLLSSTCFCPLWFSFDFSLSSLPVLSSPCGSYWTRLWMLTMCTVGRQAGMLKHTHTLRHTHTHTQSRGSGFLWSSLDFSFFFNSPLQRPGCGRLNSTPLCFCGCGCFECWCDFCLRFLFSLPFFSFFLLPHILCSRLFT